MKVTRKGEKIFITNEGDEKIIPVVLKYKKGDFEQIMSAVNEDVIDDNVNYFKSLGEKTKKKKYTVGGEKVYVLYKEIYTEE